MRLLFLFVLPAMLFAQPVERWGTYEVTLQGPETGNPYTDVRLKAVFEREHRKVEVDGFYDGSGTYRIRFMPDAVGQWRAPTSEGLAIDSAGVLSDGTRIDGPVALRKALLSRPDAFVGTVTEKLLIYALGRGLEPVDMPVVRGIVRNAATQNYAMQTILLGIVKSTPFQMRTKMTDNGPAPATSRAAKE